MTTGKLRFGRDDNRGASTGREDERGSAFRARGQKEQRGPERKAGDALRWDDKRGELWIPALAAQGWAPNLFLNLEDGSGEKECDQRSMKREAQCLYGRYTSGGRLPRPPWCCLLLVFSYFFLVAFLTAFFAAGFFAACLLGCHGYYSPFTTTHLLQLAKV